MIFSSIVMIISFLSDAFLSKYISIFPFCSSYFIPMFTIISLIIIYPYFNNENKGYFRLCFIFGMLYDIVFTNTFGLNITLFLFIGYMISVFDITFSASFFTMILKTFLVIVLFDFFNYSILLLLQYFHYNVYDLLFKILKSIPLNLIYITILYFTTEYLSKKHNIRKAN